MTSPSVSWSSAPRSFSRHRNITRSASCSIAPDSRRSDSRGSFDSRISGWRESWDRAMTGTDSSRASALSPREISDTSWTRFASRFVRGRLHELEVVDDHEVEAGLGLEPASLRPELHRGDVRRVVDVHRRLGQGVHRRRDPGEVELLEEARSEPLRVDVGDARQEAQDELLLAHLEAEDADALALADGGVLGDVEREARLADRRPAPRRSRGRSSGGRSSACRGRVKPVRTPLISPRWACR